MGKKNKALGPSKNKLRTCIALKVNIVIVFPQINLAKKNDTTEPIKNVIVLIPNIAPCSRAETSKSDNYFAKIGA